MAIVNSAIKRSQLLAYAFDLLLQHVNVALRDSLAAHADAPWICVLLEEFFLVAELGQKELLALASHEIRVGIAGLIVRKVVTLGEASSLAVHCVFGCAESTVQACVGREGREDD